MVLSFVEVHLSNANDAYFSFEAEIKFSCAIPAKYTMPSLFANYRLKLRRKSFWPASEAPRNHSHMHYARCGTCDMSPADVIPRKLFCAHPDMRERDYNKHLRRM